MSGVVDGNMYPTDGAIFSIPVEQVKEQQSEANAVLASLPVLKEILERLDERITFYKSVDSIPDDVKTKPDEFMHVVTANALVAQNLEQERTQIQGLIDDYTKKL